MKAAVFFAMTLLSQVVHAQLISVGEPGLGGTGCPAGTAHVALSSDQTEVQVYADNFVAEAGRHVGRSIDRKTCNLAIPVSVASGFQVALAAQVEGFVAANRKGQAQWSVELFSAGTRGPRHGRSFRGPMNDRFDFKPSVIAPDDLSWSHCGASTNLRANVTLLAKGDVAKGEALALIDQLHFKIYVRRCQ